MITELPLLPPGLSTRLMLISDGTTCCAAISILVLFFHATMSLSVRSRRLVLLTARCTGERASVMKAPAVVPMICVVVLSVVAVAVVVVTVVAVVVVVVFVDVTVVVTDVIDVVVRVVEVRVVMDVKVLVVVRVVVVVVSVVVNVTVVVVAVVVVVVAVVVVVSVVDFVGGGGGGDLTWYVSYELDAKVSQLSSHQQPPALLPVPKMKNSHLAPFLLMHAALQASTEL